MRIGNYVGFGEMRVNNSFVREEIMLNCMGLKNK